DPPAMPPRLFGVLRNAVHAGNGIASANRGQEDALLAAVKAALAITQFEVRQPGVTAEDYTESRWGNDVPIRRGLRIRLVRVYRVGFPDGLRKLDNLILRHVI